jgi:hypothetical protein
MSEEFRMEETPIAAAAENKPDPLWVRTSLEKYIARRLGSSASEEALVVMDAVEGAARRYASLHANHEQIRDYAERRRHLDRISRYADVLVLLIGGLDQLSVDLMRRAKDGWSPAGSMDELNFIASAAKALEEKMQRTGRPREVVEELWIKAVADIYDNFFNGEGRKLPNEDFLSFLKLCRPMQFRGKVGKVHGALTAKQVERALERTEEALDVNKKRHRPRSDIFLL